MIRSMTGFGRYEISNENFRIVVEIKTVNHRYCDIYIRMPRQISFFEDKVRAHIAKNISRGKADVYIFYENYSAGINEVHLDIDLAKTYYSALRRIVEELGVNKEISVSNIVKFSDVLKVEKKDDEDSIWEILELAVDTACKSLIKTRELEGEKLKENLLDIAGVVDSYVSEIEKKAPLVIKEYKNKLSMRIAELLEDNKIVDESRLAIEVAIFADKCSIAEEIVRIRSHINQLREILNLDVPVGRKLDFLIQEMNRETNTIGAKANDLDITKNVIELKSEIEKMREQVQNIE